MGCCCYPEPNPDGTRNCSNVSGPEGCPGGGLYTEDPCPTSVQCFFMHELGLYLAEITRCDPILEAAVAPTFSVLFDFRDLILRRSTVGREFLCFYHAHAQRAVEIMKCEPSLLKRALTVLARAALFAQDALRAATLSSDDVASGALRLDSQMLEAIRALLHDFAETAPKAEFSRVLVWLSEVLDRFEGMTTREIVRALAVEDANERPMEVGA